jgi:hypothetical protein
MNFSVLRFGSFHSHGCPDFPTLVMFLPHLCDFLIESEVNFIADVFAHSSRLLLVNDRTPSHVFIRQGRA